MMKREIILMVLIECLIINDLTRPSGPMPRELFDWSLTIISVLIIVGIIVYVIKRKRAVKKEMQGDVFLDIK
jgi:hypothetical protein